MNHENNGLLRLGSSTITVNPERSGDFTPFELPWLESHLAFNDISQKYVKDGPGGKVWEERAALEEMRQWLQTTYGAALKLEHVDELRDELATLYLQKKTGRSRRAESMQRSATSTADSTPSP